MKDTQTPYHYARDHHGDGQWCVRGPDNFYLSIPEKNLAWAVAAMLNGYGLEAAKCATEITTEFASGGCPKYLQEPAFIETRRQHGMKLVTTEAADLGMADRIEKRLDQGWSPYKGETMIGVMLDVLMEPTEDILLLMDDAACRTDTIRHGPIRTNPRATARLPKLTE